MSLFGSYRADAVAAALDEWRQHPEGRPDVYWRDVLPPGEAPPRDWCAAFILWAYHRAGMARGVKQYPSFGFVAPAGLKPTSTPLPGDVDFTVGAALVMPGLTAWQGLFEHGRLQAGQSVLVHGAAGVVGSMASQLAREAGAYVIGTGRAGARQTALDFGFAADQFDKDHLPAVRLDGFDRVLDKPLPHRRLRIEREHQRNSAPGRFAECAYPDMLSQLDKRLCPEIEDRRDEIHGQVIVKQPISGYSRQFASDAQLADSRRAMDEDKVHKISVLSL